MSLTDSQRSARYSRIDWAVIVALLACHALLSLRFWFVCDDAFITFRYARNWAETGRIFYNAGENPPVEGYSNFLWMALCAGGFRLGLDPIGLAPAGALACGTGLIALVYRRLWSSCEGRTAPAALAAGVLASATPFAVWSTSGLETMPFALALFIAADFLLRPGRGGSAAVAAIAALLAALLRVEGVLWALLLLPLGVWARVARRERWAPPLLLYVGVLAIGYGAYFAWRYAYFDTLLANSAAAKTGLNAGHLLRGAHYVLVQALTYPPLLLAAIIPMAALRRGRCDLGPPLAALALAFPAYAIAAGGDFMAFGRFLAPGLPFLAVGLGWLLDDLWRSGRIGRASGVGLAAACAGLGLAPGYDLHVVPESTRAQFHFRLNSPAYRSEYQQWRFQNQTAVEFARKGMALRQAAQANDSLVEVAIGAVGYYSRLTILDQVGLVTPGVARSTPRREVWRSPGHDRWVEPTFFLEAGVAPTILASTLTPALPAARLAQAAQAWLAGLRISPQWLAGYGLDARAVRIRGQEGGGTRYLLMLRRGAGEDRPRGAESGEQVLEISDVPELSRLAR